MWQKKKERRIPVKHKSADKYGMSGGVITKDVSGKTSQLYLTIVSK